MKKYFISTMTALSIFLFSSCQVKISEVVRSAFSAKFPGATNVKWEKETSKELEANFKMNNTDISANFKLDGTWVETETTIPVTELPDAVSKAVNTQYPGAAYGRVEKIEKPGGKISYEVNITVKGKKKELELNPDGTNAE